MKTFILVKENRRGVFFSLYCWWSKPLLEHLIKHLLFFKSISDIYVIHSSNKKIEYILSKLNIDLKHQIIIPSKIDELQAVSYIKPLLSSEEHFALYSSDIYIQKPELKRVVKLEKLNYSMIITYRYYVPLPEIDIDNRDGSLRLLIDNSFTLLPTGMYILPYKIFDLCGKFDTITQALMQLEKKGTKTYTFDIYRYRNFLRYRDFEND